jgi:hypothetical protein
MSVSTYQDGIEFTLQKGLIFVKHLFGALLVIVLGKLLWLCGL